MLISHAIWPNRSRLNRPCRRTLTPAWRALSGMHMWPFKRKSAGSLQVNSVTQAGATVVIDVRGQTCPGYLLAINKAVDELDAGTLAVLQTTYTPCVADIKAWCKERQLTFIDSEQQGNTFLIRIRK